jgi:hypothetical protein
MWDFGFYDDILNPNLNCSKSKNTPEISTAHPYLQLKSLNIAISISISISISIIFNLLVLFSMRTESVQELVNSLNCISLSQMFEFRRFT